MPSTSTAICNSALAKLGAERILSIDDNSARAKLMKEQYAKIRDELLYSHPWNFSIKRTTLAAAVTPPLFDYGFSYPLPADCLRVIGTDLPPEVRWQVEGRNLICDFNAVKVKYISLVLDEAQFTPGFVELFACKLASDLAFSVTQSSTVEANAYKKYEEKLRQIRSFDAQESNGDRVYSDGWLNSRS